MGLPAIGLGISAIGQLGGALSANSANRRNEQRVQSQTDYMRRLLGGMFQRDPGAAEQGLGNAMQNFLPSGQSFKHTPYDAAQVTMPGIDSEGILGGFNTGQDALMQFLNRNPAEDMGALVPNLEGILSNGNPFDVGSTFDALRASDDYQFNRALAEFRGSAGSLGQRFGTAMGQRENDLTAQLTNQLQARNAGIAQNAFESAQGRRLDAGNILSQLYQSQGNQTLQGLGLQQQGAQSIADFLSGQQGLAAQLGLANQGATNQASQFNAGLGLDAFNANQAARGGDLQRLLQALQLQGGLEGDRRGYNAQLAALLSGQPIAQSQPNSLFGTIGDLGQSAALLPFMQQILATGPRPVTRAA